MRSLRLQEKIIEYGTTHKVIVESSSLLLIVCVCKENGEGYLLTGHGIKAADLPKKGEKGTIIFERGGIKGGYWKYLKSIE